MLNVLNNPGLQHIDATDAYLRSTDLIDFDHPRIQAYVASNPRDHRTEEQVAESLYLFVRDEINHCWDVQDPRVTAKASEVLEHRVGICYAKSHLLAALLRAYGIPAGLCYQRLTLGDNLESGFCVHGLNTVYIQSLDRWIRLDARGNKPGVNAQFSLRKEHLAFNVREEIGEVDYRINYADTHPLIAKTLSNSNDSLQLCTFGLPTELK
jgi:transglutaminase-like putative cysteine protease